MVIDSGTGWPSICGVVHGFVQETVCSRKVLAGGSGGNLTELQGAVVTGKDEIRIWKYQERFDVELRCDDWTDWCCKICISHVTYT